MAERKPYPNPKKVEDALDASGPPPEALDDVAADGGGQRSEVAHPYDAQGGAVRGTENAQHSDKPPHSEDEED